MSSIWRSRFGLFLGGGYLLFVLLTLANMAGSGADAMSVLAPMFLTAPWSFLLAEYLPENALAGTGTYGFYFLLSACGVLNATILYFIGVLISFVDRALR